jgi:hypothetical protein
MCSCRKTAPQPRAKATDTLLRNSAILARAVRRTADETLRPLEEQLAQQRFQTAAE